MPEDILIRDESSDKKYFTVIPNMIINGYNAVESGIYLYMKRKAGDQGTFYESCNNACKKLGVSKPHYLKILRKFEREGTIKLLGLRNCKTRPVREYVIENIWKKNIDTYKKIGKPGNLSIEKGKDRTTTELMIGKPQHLKKNLYKKNQYTLLYSPLKKYSSLKDIQESDLMEISERYKIPPAFVKLCLEKMTNWLEAKGKSYKNYKRGLMNWVLSEAQKKMENRQKKGGFVDASQL